MTGHGTTRPALSARATKATGGGTVPGASMTKRAMSCKRMARMLRGPKFRNSPTRCRDGVMHQSQLESRRCDELHLMEAGGLIRDLEAHPQPRYKLDVNEVHICDYLADFRYFDVDRGEEVVEDTKGFMTDVARMKLKLMEAIHGVAVQLVRKVGRR